MKAGLLFLEMVFAVVFAVSAHAEIVTFPGRDVTIRAELFRPDGEGLFPAVVALHGCGGLYRKDGALTPRDADWAQRLTGAGFIVLFPDSFGSRGAQSQCKTDSRVARASRERPDDAIAAARYLASRPDVKAGTINLVGWSNGGSTVLYTLRRVARRDGNLPFAKAVAFYPGCRVPLERGDWRTSIPFLLLIGEADDWTPAEPCRALVGKAQAAGEPASLVTYADAYHSFDHPDLPMRLQRGLAYTGSGSGVAHTGTNVAARDNAISRVMSFLAR